MQATATFEYTETVAVDTTTPDITSLTDEQINQLHTYAIAAVRSGAARPELLTAVNAERARRNPNATTVKVTPPAPVGPDRPISRTRLTSGFDTITIEVKVANGRVDVTGLRTYTTHRTVWVDDVKTRTFFNLPDAERFAGQWVEHLTRKGWK